MQVAVCPLDEKYEEYFSGTDPIPSISPPSFEIRYQTFPYLGAAPSCCRIDSLSQYAMSSAILPSVLRSKAMPWKVNGLLVAATPEKSSLYRLIELIQLELTPSDLRHVDSGQSSYR